MEKKILVVYAKNTKELVNRQSALGSYIFCLCEILQKNKLNVFVNGIRFTELKQQPSFKSMTQPVATGGMKKIIPEIIKGLLKDLRILKNNARLFEEIENSATYDCILEFYSYASDIGYKLSQKQNIPLAIVYDAPIEEEYTFFHKHHYFFKKKILKREMLSLLQAKSIVVYSNSVKEYLIKRNIKQQQLFVHQNVDFTRFDFIEEKSFTEQVVNIGFIGSFLKWHRVDLLLSAFTDLKERNYPVHLYLLGQGEEYNAIKERVDKNKYKESITMPGFVDGKELLQLKKRIHIGVMPGSNWYGAPNKIFEYGASSMAVVAPGTPTISDLFIKDKEIILFTEDAADALYEALKTLCENREKMRSLAFNLQENIRNNHSENNTFAFYYQLINNSLS